jgi:acyl-CoA synthetase (AMP-forming)/AMP-acid ligase II
MAPSDNSVAPDTTTPATSIDAQLQAAGGPFEIAEIELNGAACRVFRRAPTTLGQVFAAARQFADKEFIVYNDQRLTYAQVFAQAAALAGAIARQVDVRKGSRIAIVMHNRPEWVIGFIAIASLGATAVLVNSRGTANELQAALAVSDSELIIADEGRARLLGEQTRPMIVVAAERDSTFAPNWQSFTDAIADGQQANLQPVDVAPDDEAIVMFTSGTTGGAKGARLSHRNVLTGLMNIQYSMAVVGTQVAARYGIDLATLSAMRPPAALLVFPLFHSSGCYSVLLSNMVNGGKIVILPKWNAEHALDLIERESIAGFAGSPTMWWDMLQIDRTKRDTKSIFSIGMGGQALHKKLLEEVAAAFPQAMVGVGYGMTETNGTICQLVGPALLERPGASGRILPTAEVRIVLDDGSEAAVDEVGEIWVRGAMVMQGYCSNPKATAEALLPDGWLRTGDMARIDGDGYLYVVDRKKHIVISGGENISCTEVEAAALEFPGVSHAAAMGIPDDRLGEKLVLAMVAQPSVDDEALKKHIAERLAIYKVPRQIVRLEALPYNALGKVNRAALLPQVRTLVES